MLFSCRELHPLWKPKDMMNQILSSVTACLYTTFSSKTIYCVYHFRKEELIKNKLSWQILLTG